MNVEDEMKGRWRPAPETRAHIAQALQRMQGCEAQLHHILHTLCEPGYHETQCYVNARSRLRELREEMRQMEHLLAIQQGLEHKSYADVVCSGLLALGDALFTRKETDHGS